MFYSYEFKVFYFGSKRNENEKYNYEKIRNKKSHCKKMHKRGKILNNVFKK